MEYTFLKTSKYSKIIILLLLVVVAVYYFYNRPKFVEEHVEELNVATTTVDHITKTTDGKVEVLKTGKVPVKSDEWKLVIQLSSLSSDLIIGKESWMNDPSIYSKELTELEQKQKENIQTQQAGFQQIIASEKFKQQFIENINKSIGAVENDKVAMMKEKEGQEKFLTTFNVDKSQLSTDLRLGADKIQKNTESIIKLMDDILSLADMLISAKNSTIKNTLNENVVQMSVSANDEDTLSLIINWHLEGLERLKLEQKQMVNKVEQIKS